MSAIVQVKSLIIANFNSDKRIKKALLDLMNELDSDLDVQGYEQSSLVDNALVAMDKALIEVEEEIEKNKSDLINSNKIANENDEDEEDDIHGFKERIVGVDDDEEEDDSRSK